MNTQGPYYLSPYGEGPGEFGQISLEIPVILGRNGYLEVINLSNYNIKVSLQSMGAVTQEARSKVLYKIVQDIQGTQMITLSTPPDGVSPISARFIRLPISYENGETGFFGVWFNTYEEGEIEPYGPVSISNPPAQSSYFISKSSGAPLSLTLPNTATYYGVPANLGTCDLIGFDLTSTGATAANASFLLNIGNLNNQPDGSTALFYQQAAASGASIVPLIVRFPTPIPNFGGLQITFNLTASAGFAGATFDLNAYYTLT